MYFSGSALTQAPLFDMKDVDPQEINQLALKSIQAQCLAQISQQGSSSLLTQSAPSRLVKLQIIEDWIVQRSIDGNAIVSTFKCDYEIQFQIIRKISQVPNKLGEAQGIRFYFINKDNLKVQLRVKQEQRRLLQRFCRILGRKYIIQLGFHAAFKAIKKIGKGMTACVYNAISFASGREVAIKSFKRSVYFAQDNNNGKISFCKEFKILSEVNHKNLCQLHSVFQTDNSTYVIMQLYPLSLYGYLQKIGFPGQPGVKSIITNLLEGIAYLHEKGIMHRDLKLQNIMVRKDDKAGVIPVIVDFGLAQYLSASKYLYTRCGTPGYVAPQVLKIKSNDPIQSYTGACDVFSLGVILHILLFHKPVFQGKDGKEVIKKNCQCIIDFNGPTYSTLSLEAKDLLQKMLAINPSERITAKQALVHPYLCPQMLKSCSSEAPNHNNLSTTYQIQNE